MKKLLTIVLALALTLTACFGLTACSNGKVVQDGGKIVVGITDYAPMDYLEDNKWVGFDAELAETVFTNLGYTVEFKEIDWDTKIVTLNAGTIDCIWNGMTVTDELLSNLLLTTPYLKNIQVAVVKTENVANYTDASSLEGKKVAVESGSAAESLVEGLSDVTCNLRKLTNQNAAVMEVSANTSDVAIVDLLLARNLCLSSDYLGVLSYVDIGLCDEEYEEFAVAFRKSDSKLLYNVNKEIDKLKKDNTILTLALKYGIADSIL